MAVKYDHKLENVRRPQDLLIGEQIVTPGSSKPFDMDFHLKNIESVRQQ